MDRKAETMKEGKRSKVLESLKKKYLEFFDYEYEPHGDAKEYEILEFAYHVIQDLEKENEKLRSIISALMDDVTNDIFTNQKLSENDLDIIQSILKK